MYIDSSRLNPATTDQRRAEYSSHYQNMEDDERSSQTTLWLALVGLGIFLLIGLAGLVKG